MKDNRIFKVLLIVTASLILMVAMCLSASAEEIVLPDIISDHMLLQQGETIRLWGTVAPGEDVNVKITANDAMVAETTVKADDAGAFIAELPTMSPGGPYEIAFATKTSTKTVSDVLIGELWIQSGQSNMAMKTKATGDYAAEMLPKEPINDIRLFMNAKDQGTEERQSNLAGEWKIADAETVSTYSAMGWCSLKVIYDELKVPVGGICNPVSGANMAQYTPPEVPGEPGGKYFNTKIAPILNMNVRGIMWNQGSSDRTKKDFTERFNTLISRWRNESKDDHMYFVYMTLAPSAMKYYASWLDDYQVRDNSLARLRQIQTYYETEDTSFVVSIDRAPQPTDKDPIHPLNKKPVSDRLGRTVLGSVYGKIENWQSPLYKTSKKNGKSVDIILSYAYGGLKTTDGEAPRCFKVAQEENVFFDAKAEIINENTIRLTCDAIDDIKYVSYSIERHLFPYTSAQDAVMHTYPDVNVVNSENLPMAPFYVEVGEERAEKVFDNFATVPQRVDIEVAEKGNDAAEVLENPFSDIKLEDAFYEAVLTVYHKGLMNGVGDGEFAPEASLSKAMLLTVLSRMEGIEAAQDTSWYAAAAEWAKEKGLSDANSDEALLAPLTNLEMSTILYAYLQGGETEQIDPTEWLIRNFIIKYDLDDNALVTRAQAATAFENMTK
ncbi:MAG: hypothetical protein E7403_06880 [Ruminococcaceae bacterium]|nr:hypothetical protein [Oscillospiraceae bacterium]